MRVAERFFWPGWENEVKNYVISCQQCQQAKASRQNTAAPLQSILSSRPIEILTADIMGPIKPKSNSGFEYILVVCDHFTKYAEVFPLRNTEALTVAKALIKFISRHGIPDEIITDQGRNFQSELLENVYRLLDIHRKRTAAYHPQTDGLSEKFVGTFKNMIRVFLVRIQRIGISI